LHDFSEAEIFFDTITIIKLVISDIIKNRVSIQLDNHNLS